MKTELEYKEKMAKLRANWARAKSMLDEGKASAIQAIIQTHGLKISKTGFLFCQLQMQDLGLDGLPYLDCKTFKGWKENGFIVDKGQKSNIDGITWITCQKKENKEQSYMVPKAYYLFHRSQVHPID